ncbi:GDP-mannose transporter GONST4 [Diplonema papillatum]|nr:GDP-mannose transporter GONST4 [Diplonema papillatum]
MTEETENSRGQVFEVLLLAGGFAFSSSLLVVINKWALKYFKYGAALAALQFAVSAFVAWFLGVTGQTKVDSLDRKKVMGFMPAVCMFYISVATNLKLLEISNVDTYIVVRSLVPIFTLGLEMAYLKSPWPGVKTFLALLLIFFGACGYVAHENHFQWHAYFYAITYLFAFTIDQVLIKKIVMDVKLTRWGLVYYNNLLALVLMPIGGLVTGEWASLRKAMEDPKLVQAMLEPQALLPIGLSCLFGLSISFFALNARRALTATAFTVLGVVCKFVTVFVNTLAWDEHASSVGIACVCVCISGGIIFQQVQGAAVMTPAPKPDLETTAEAAEAPSTK